MESRLAVLGRGTGWGALSGLVAGGGVGTVFAPILGTLIGGMVGMPVGAVLGLVSSVPLALMSARPSDTARFARAGALAAGVSGAALSLTVPVDGLVRLIFALVCACCGGLAGPRVGLGARRVPRRAVGGVVLLAAGAGALAGFGWGALVGVAVGVFVDPPALAPAATAEAALLGSLAGAAAGLLVGAAIILVRALRPAGSRADRW